MNLKAISTKNLVPALAGIKFDLTNEGLTLTASDNDITIRSFIKNDDNMSIEEEGSIIIQGRYILDIVRKLPDKVINLEVFDEMKVIISTENSEYNLNGINKNYICDNDVFAKLTYKTDATSALNDPNSLLYHIINEDFE